MDQPNADEEPRFLGCAAHGQLGPDPDCDDCCMKYGVKPGSKNRAALLSPGMLASRWQPGESGNPDGRPAGSRTFEGVVNKILDEEVNSDLGPVERREALGRVLVDQALRNNPRRWAMELLVNKLWPEESKINMKFPGPVQVIYDDQDDEA